MNVADECCIHFVVRARVVTAVFYGYAVVVACCRMAGDTALAALCNTLPLRKSTAAQPAGVSQAHEVVS